jgi:hypothetical protein
LPPERRLASGRVSVSERGCFLRRGEALIDEASVIERILRHLGLPTDVPTARPGRAPPLFAACAFDEDMDGSSFAPCH